MKVTVGVLLANGFPVPAPFLISYSLLQQWMLTGKGNEGRKVQIDSAQVLWGQDFPVDFARNRICQLFLDNSDSDYLLFLDADMTHLPDMPHRLIQHQLDVVTARYVMRKPPFFSVAMRKVGPGLEDYQALEKLMPFDDITGLQPIDAGGAGALMISRWVLTEIRKKFGDDWFRYQDGQTGLRSRSEDMWFYERVRDVGVQPYLDADLRCGHIASFVVDERNHEPYHDAFLRGSDIEGVAV